MSPLLWPLVGVGVVAVGYAIAWAIVTVADALGLVYRVPTKPENDVPRLTADAYRRHTGWR